MWTLSCEMSADWEVGELCAVLCALGASQISVNTGPTPDTVIVCLGVPSLDTLTGMLIELNAKGWKR